MRALTCKTLASDIHSIYKTLSTHTVVPDLCEVWSKGVYGLQQVSAQVSVAACKQAAEAGHNTPDELITLKHPVCLVCRCVHVWGCVGHVWLYE